MILHLVAPGLFDRPPGQGTDPRVPVLERFVAQARREDCPGGHAETLFTLCGVALAPDRDAPAAAVSWLADTARAPPGYLLHADPVHLVPDQDRLLLFRVAADTLPASTVAALHDAFNRHFAEEGLRLEAPRPQRWYLHTATPAHVRTAALHEVVGRNVQEFLPDGPDGRAWRRRLNEVQMLFHPLAEAADLPVPVNGLWFSGGGQLPDTARALEVRHGEHPLPRGLQRLGEGVVGAGPPVACWHFDDLLAATLAGDAVARAAALRRCDALLADLLRQRPAGIVLHPCQGLRFHWRPALRWRWWRRARPLAEVARASAGG